MLRNWMGRLLLWQKFCLLGLLGAALFAAPSWLYLQLSLPALSTARLELAGAQPALQVLQALDLVSRYRIALGAGTGADTSRAAAAQAIGSLAELPARFPDAALAKASAALQAHWAETLKAAPGAAALAAADQVAGDLQDVGDRLLDASGLSLDPEVASYYLVALALMEPPGLRENLAQVRRLVDGAPATSGLKVDERLHLTAEMQRARDHLDNLGRYWAKALAADSSLADSHLGDAVAALQKSGNAAIDAVAGLARARRPAVLPERGVLNTLDEVAAREMAFAQAADGALQAILQARVRQMEHALVTAGAVLGALVLLALLLGVRIVRSVTVPMAQAVAMADRLAAGDLGGSIEVHGRDEAARLAKAMVALRDAMARLVEQLQGAVREAGEGRFAYRLDTSGLRGFQGEIATGLNAVMETTEQGLSEVGRVLGAVAHGRLDERLDRPARGAWDELRRYTNTTVDALDRLVAQLRRVVAEANGGNFKVAVDAAGLEGFQRDIAQGLNTLMVTTDRGLSEVTRVLGAVARGELDQRIEGSYQGEFDQLKRYANETVEVLARLVGQLRGLVDQANAGEFSGRVTLAGLAGFQRDLAEGLNALMANTEEGLAELSRVLGAVADGDLSRRAADGFQGAFGRLMEDANATARNLAAMVGDIQATAGAVNQAAAEISAGNTDLSQRTEEQAQSIERLAASMDELTAAVRGSADHAREASTLAAGASDVAARGGELVGEVVRTMDSIHESSRRIAEIISVIDGIAFQTNILALNAAVEAARAGEQGRGFAVVATEVRNLAQRSGTAAREIRTLIADSTARVDAGASLVQRAGTTMEEILGSVRGVSTIMTEISSAAEAQSRGIADAHQAVGQLDDTTQRNAALVEESAAAAESLEQQAQGLVETTARFVLARPAAA